MQTMPLMEQAAADLDPERVRLVSVNLEEPAEHLRGVVERHEIEVPVALDIDGVTARRYEVTAIPQLVIVDQQGQVARLYIGGGVDVVEQAMAAVAELLAGSGETGP